MVRRPHAPRRLGEHWSHHDRLAWHCMAWHAEAWHTTFVDATLVLGQQGRLVIPAEVRSALGLSAGDRLHLHVAGGRLVLQRRQDAVAELRRLGDAVPKSRSLVAELLTERRTVAEVE